MRRTVIASVLDELEATPGAEPSEAAYQQLTSCEKVETRFRAIASREQGCGPYLFAVNAPPKDGLLCTGRPRAATGLH